MLRCLNQLKILSLVAGCFISNGITAQIPPLLSPGQPEQDACNAVVLCSNSFYTPYSYTGVGQDSDLTSLPCSGTEMNSVWIKLNITSSGKIIFKLMPIDTANDYDFAVLNSTKTTCDNLTSADVVRCNFNSNNPGSNVGGIIGLDSMSTISNVENGTIGNSFCQAIDAVKGETYLVMINNFGNYITPQTGVSGFTIDFTGSTAIFNNATPPEINSIDIPCSGTSVILHLNNEVICSSIAPDGSDFMSNAPVAIISAAGISCDNDSSYTDSIIVNFAAPLPAGNYTIEARKGNDGNTLLNPCNNALVLPSKQISFIISSRVITEKKIICNEQLPYIWNGIAVTTGGDSAAVYTTVSSSGCDSTTILNLSVGEPLAEITVSKTICSNQSYTLPWDSTVTSAGTYTHLYKNIAGCDSLLEQVILKDAPGSVVENKSICNEQLPYVWNGITVTKGGDQAAVYTTASSTGCDSITILNLNVDASPAQNTIAKTFCSGQSYTLPWDSTVTSSGTYAHLYKNKAGCDSLIEQVVLKDSFCLEFLQVPTAFTPNNDNKNDFFKPLISGTLLQYSFVIYNRWGKMIFFSKEPLKGWDGTVDGIQQPLGTYVWICNYQLAGQSFFSQKGTVTLIR